MRQVLRAIALSVLPVLFLMMVRQVSGAPILWSNLILCWVFVIGVLAIGHLAHPVFIEGSHWMFSWTSGVLFALAGLAWVGYAFVGGIGLAWIALAFWYAFVIVLDQVLASGRRMVQAWIKRGLLLGASGTVPVLVAQVQTRFSEEEFFVALYVVALSFLSLLLLLASHRLGAREQVDGRHGVILDVRHWGVTLSLIAAVGLALAIREYQTSFYPTQAPEYSGISTTTPFLCGQAVLDNVTFDGKDVFRRLIARIQANPFKGVPEYGMLALGTRDQNSVLAFRRELMGEAERGAFTGPSNSVKSSQYEAAVRVYYYSKMRLAFPDLFSQDDQAKLRQWFAAINRRALTTEWVDWMYGVAFSKFPEGPYENQENGAGLLAILESTSLAPPELSSSNRSYLDRNQRGWERGFRNTDDAFIYQPEWIVNALFQSMYTGRAPRDSIRQSFEWILLQALSDGSPLRYNHPDSASAAGIAYLGAQLLGDPQFVWLSGRALTDLESKNQYLYAQPGVEQAVDLVGHSPDQGSCLLYGDSGLPNQKGPLAPDKIVFRDGWSTNASSLLVNLRFTGWHRYKGTNTITLLSKDGPIVSDMLEGQPFAWLPVGRSLFRDKRIPRENLNGLLVERSGMDKVIYQLIGSGGPWAQDPPFYARVTQFETGADFDTSTTELQGWNGWQNQRTVDFYHSGPIIVIDHAYGPVGQTAAVSWHVAGDATMKGARLSLRSGESPAEMVILPFGLGPATLQRSNLTDNASTSLAYTSASGQLDIVTVFLMNDWVGAQVELKDPAEHPVLTLSQAGKQITVPISMSSISERQ